MDTLEMHEDTGTIKIVYDNTYPFPFEITDTGTKEAVCLTKEEALALYRFLGEVLK